MIHNMVPLLIIAFYCSVVPLSDHERKYCLIANDCSTSACLADKPW